MASRLAQGVKEFSFKVFDNLIDVLLFLLILQLQGKKSSFERALEGVRILRGKKLKNAYWNARKRGLVIKKDSFWQITEQGIKRLNNVLPRYYQKRPWDGKVYLITYDIPENRKNDRDLLREYLKKLGSGMLQASVWLTPYNPRGSLKSFLKQRKLYGWVIISDIGEDGSVGLFNLKDLMVKVYKLKILNNRYKEFIQLVKQKKIKGLMIGFQYLSILGDDPQLPFDLLPSDWLGDRAYQLYRRFLYRRSSGGKKSFNIEVT